MLYNHNKISIIKIIISYYIKFFSSNNHYIHIEYINTLYIYACVYNMCNACILPKFTICNMCFLCDILHRKHTLYIVHIGI